MPSWPVQGDNAGTWGTDLNSCLLVSHNSDGTFLIGGSGAAAGRVLLSQASGTGGVQTDSKLTWAGGTGPTVLSVSANSGQAANVELLNAATTEWYLYNLGSNNTFHLDSATLGALAFTQAGVLTLPQYGAGILNTSAAGIVSATGAWTNYTPTVASGGPGTVTTASAVGYYMLLGKTLVINIHFIITTNGTATQGFTATLPASLTPFTSISGQYGNGWSNSGTGTPVTVACYPNDGHVYVFTSTATSINVSGTVIDASICVNVN